MSPTLLAAPQSQPPSSRDTPSTPIVSSQSPAPVSVGLKVIIVLSWIEKLEVGSGEEKKEMKMEVEVKEEVVEEGKEEGYEMIDFGGWLTERKSNFLVTMRWYSPNAMGYGLDFE